MKQIIQIIIVTVLFPVFLIGFLACNVAMSFKAGWEKADEFRDEALEA